MRNISRAASLVLSALLVISITDAFGQRSPGKVPAKELPVAVHDVFIRTYPKATIEKWTLVTREGKSIYDIKSSDDGRTHHILYSEDGTLIEVRDLLIASEYPESIRKSASARYPQSKILRVEKRVAGTAVHYAVQVRKKNRKLIDMVMDESGTIVK